MGDAESLGDAVLHLSTDDADYNLGIDAAQSKAVEMDKAFTKTHESIKEKFSEKFEHVGVHLFGMDMLRSIGITEGARPILGALMLSVSQVAEAFGVAAGSVGLWIFGLGALAAIVWKVIESHEKHSKSLEELADKQEKGMESTANLIDKLEKYKTQVGQVTPVINDLIKSTKELNRIQANDQVKTLNESIKATEEKVKADKDAIASLEHLIGYIERSSKTQLSAILGTEHYSGALAGAKVKLDEANSSLIKNKQALDDQKASLEKVKEGWSGLNSAMTAADKNDQAKIAFQKKIIELTDHEAARYKEAAKQKQEADQRFYDHFQGVHERMEQKVRGFFGLQATMTQDYEKIAGKSVQDVGQVFGDSFSSMLLHGTNVWDGLKAGFTKMAESMIADIIKVIIEQTILLALETATGTEGGGGLGFLGNIGGRAGGGPIDAGVPYIVGENGPELRVFGSPGAIIPNEQLTGGQGAGGGQNVVQNFNINGLDFSSPEAVRAFLRTAAAQMRAGAADALAFAQASANQTALQPRRAY